MTTRRNRDAFDDERRPDGDQVYVQEVPSGVTDTAVVSGPIPLPVDDDVAPKLDRAEARELIGDAQVEPSGAVMGDEPGGDNAIFPVLDLGETLIGTAEVEPSGAVVDDELGTVDEFTICDETHL